MQWKGSHARIPEDSIPGKNCSDRVKSVTDWVISVSDFALSVTDFTQTAAEFTLSVADITQTVAEFTLSVTDFTQTVTEITLSVTDRVISVSDLTQSVMDFTQTAADFTLSVTDLTLSEKDFSPFLNNAHKIRRENTKSEMLTRLRPTLARQEAESCNAFHCCPSWRKASASDQASNRSVLWPLGALRSR